MFIPCLHHDFQGWIPGRLLKLCQVDDGHLKTWDLRSSRLAFRKDGQGFPVVARRLEDCDSKSVAKVISWNFFFRAISDVTLWVFPKIEVGFSIINYPFWGPTPIFGKKHMFFVGGCWARMVHISLVPRMWTIIPTCHVGNHFLP